MREQQNWVYLRQTPGFLVADPINHRYVEKNPISPGMWKKSDKTPVSQKNRINPRYVKQSDKPPVFGPQFFWVDKPPECGPALMARGCFGALRLAAARPILCFTKTKWVQ